MSKNYETPDVIGVKALDNYLIYIKYKTEEEKIYDMKELICTNKFYRRLKEQTYFRNVRPRGDSVQWENGEDISPENLYYDSINIEEFQGLIKELD